MSIAAVHVGHSRAAAAIQAGRPAPGLAGTDFCAAAAVDEQRSVHHWQYDTRSGLSISIAGGSALNVAHVRVVSVAQ